LEINQIKRKMLIKYPFFGSIVANLSYVESKECPTLGTDGRIIYYNTEFIQNLNEKQQVFVFAHEVCHIAFNHLERRKGKNFKFWNIATDAVINAFLKKDGLEMVEGCVDIPDAINYDAEEFYEKLLEELEKNESQKKNESASKEMDVNSSEKSEREVDENESEKFEEKTVDGWPKELSEQQQGHDKHDLWGREKSNDERKNVENNFGEGNRVEEKERQVRNSLEQKQFNKDLEKKMSMVESVVRNPRSGYDVYHALKEIALVQDDRDFIVN